MFNTFCGQSKIKNELTAICKSLTTDINGSVNILIRGPAGSGKTLLAFLFLIQLCGNDFSKQIPSKSSGRFSFEERYKHLRGHFVDEVHTIKDFATMYPLMDIGRYVFVFATNEYGELPDAFLSRCIIFNMERYSDDEIKTIIIKHAKSEKVTLSEESAKVSTAPEPSSSNMQPVLAALRRRPERLKLGAIIDPDGDRIRFTDGQAEISMNQFGAMAYHFLHEVKGNKGMVAKTVASSNLANAIAKVLGEKVFEPPVGFKEFKPVIGRALVYFEESDGISVIGHTPEKDAFIGLLLALDMVLTQGKNLGEILRDIEQRYGGYYPDRDGVTVSQKGSQLLEALARLDRYREGEQILVGNKFREIKQVIAIDGRKMIFADNSWLMIRPSGTEPKVRFYVEARNREDTAALVAAAKSMLAEIGLLP